MCRKVIVAIILLICIGSSCLGSADELRIMPDTTFVYVPYEKGLHFNLWFEGGTIPLSVESQVEGSSWKKYKNKITDNQVTIDLDFDQRSIENGVNSIGLNVKDKKKQSAMWYIMLYRYSKDENWYSAIHCDKPFAKVGDEITITLINENRPDKVKFDCHFEIVEANDIYYAYSDSAKVVSNVVSTEKGFVVTPEYSGSLFLIGGFDNQENVYCISVVE